MVGEGATGLGTAVAEEVTASVEVGVVAAELVLVEDGAGFTVGASPGVRPQAADPSDIPAMRRMTAARCRGVVVMMLPCAGGFARSSVDPDGPLPRRSDRVPPMIRRTEAVP